jgi:hypothetical protein
MKIDGHTVVIVIAAVFTVQYSIPRRPLMLRNFGKYIKFCHHQWIVVMVVIIAVFRNFLFERVFHESAQASNVAQFVIGAGRIVGLGRDVDQSIPQKQLCIPGL